MKLLENWRHDELARLGASTNSGKAHNHAIAAGIAYHRKFYKTLQVHAMLSLPGWQVFIEPWFKSATGRLRSPDAVLLNRATEQAVVVEVKKNWADGRDVKLLDEYLPIAKSAFSVPTFPLMVVGNVRGLKHRPLTSMGKLLTALDWLPGDPTPTLLKP